MKKNIFQRPMLCGFSLAEALISLLMVCIVTIASIPVITRKHKTESKIPRGKYICTLNNAGVHQYSLDNGKTWVPSGAGCKFSRPAQARNFAITMVGGGGGGSDAALVSNKTYFGTTNFIPEPGIWNFVAIGGGGNGGWVNVFREFRPEEVRNGERGGLARATSCWGGGGAAGGAGYVKYEVPKGNYRIELKKAEVQEGVDTGNVNNTGFNGQDSTVKLIDGSNNAKNLLVAKGGGGGQHNINNCGSPFGGKQGGVSGVSGITTIKSSLGNGARDCGNGRNKRNDCHGRFDSSSVSRLNSLIGESLLKTNETNYIGQGGYPRNLVDSTQMNSGGHWFYYGGQGYVKAWATVNKSGKGGEAGQVPSQIFAPSLEKNVQIKIGHGGTNGEDGGDTIIDNGRYFALGGKGSSVGGEEAAKDNIPGGNGEASKMYYKATQNTTPLGGLQTGNQSLNGLNGITYGAGGGGGAVYYNGSSYSYGYGGKGAAGAVIIEW